MTRLAWDVVGERFYESGVDRGVLYVSGTGYAWPGLTSVSESPTGGEAKPFYIDGFKYLNISASEEFEASIEAFSAPPQFAPCEGVNTMYSGLLITQQPRRAFGFSYRTKVGNDVDGLDHAYKVHLVYNALAAPSERSYSTVNDQAEAPTRTWDLTTLAPKIYGYRPTAHFVVDSRTTPEATMTALEDILYGTDTTAPRQPTVTQLMELFGAPVYDGGEITVPESDTIMDGGLP